MSLDKRKYRAIVLIKSQTIKLSIMDVNVCVVVNATDLSHYIMIYRKQKESVNTAVV